MLAVGRTGSYVRVFYWHGGLKCQGVKDVRLPGLAVFSLKEHHGQGLMETGAPQCQMRDAHVALGWVVVLGAARAGRSTVIAALQMGEPKHLLEPMSNLSRVLGEGCGGAAN